MPHEDFDPNTWSCPCGGAADVYELKSGEGVVQYHVLECKTCGNWRRFVPELGDQEIGKELPEELKAALDERGEKIRMAPDPLAGAEAIMAAPEPMPAPPWEKDADPVVKKDRGEPLQPRSEDGTAPLDIKLPLSDEPGFPPGSMDPSDPMMMEQGTIMSCGYCRYVYPDLGKDCPVCRGSGPGFRPARMMDRQTSLSEVLRAFFNLAELEWQLRDADGEPSRELLKEYKSRLLNVVEMMGLYQFDAKAALIDRIYELDLQYEIDPKEEF